MSIFLKPGMVKVRQEDDEFSEINILAESSSQAYLDAIQAKGEEVLESIPSEYGDLVEEVDGKLDSPQTAGTSGQVLTSDGQGGQSWETPASDAVTDVQINGTSVLDNGVANIPIADTINPGVVSIGSGLTKNNNNKLVIDSAGSETIKQGTNVNQPIVPGQQHTSVFYGLAKASGDATQSASSNSVGNYTSEAKASIKNMLGVQDVTVDSALSNSSTNPVENRVVKQAIDDVVMVSETQPVSPNNEIWIESDGESVEIPTMDDVVTNVQVNGASITTNGIADIPKAGDNTLGVVKGRYYGVRVNNDGDLYISTAAQSEIKAGTSNYLPIVPNNQHQSAFYGLAKAAGDTTQSQSSNSVGTYTNDAKSAIQNMLNVPDKSELTQFKENKADIIISNASNSVASFSDGAEYNAVGLVAEFAPYQEGTGDPSPENIRPIHGWTGLDIIACGKNQFDINKATLGAYIVAEGITEERQLGDVLTASNYGISDYIPIISGKQYTISVPRFSSASVAGHVLFSDYNSPVIGISMSRYTKKGSDANEGAYYTFVTPSNVKFIRFTWTYINGAGNNCKFEEGDTYTDYEPYQGTITSISWQTETGKICGGYIDVVKGELVVTHVYYEAPLSTFKKTEYEDRNGYTKNNIDLGGVITTAGNMKISNLAPYQWQMPPDGLVSKFWASSSASTGMTTIYMSLSKGVPDETVFQMCAPFIEPIHYQLNPVTIKLLKGYNNIFTSAGGNVDVEYRADTKLYLETHAPKVDDVQINGTSVVNDGVANVPVMDSNNFGVAKIQASLGIGITGGKLALALPTTTQIKNGNAEYGAITTLKQHESVFYGLAKLAGANMASSDNPVGTYTEEAKIAIQKMLGIYEAPWELIRDVTCSEDTGYFIISTDTNGESFALKKALIYVEAPKTTTGTRDYISASWRAVNSEGVENTLMFPNIQWVGSASPTLFYYELDCNGVTPQCTSALAVSGYDSTASYSQTANYINSGSAIYLKWFTLVQYNNNSSLIPSGTRVRLYGQRYVQ